MRVRAATPFPEWALPLAEGSVSGGPSLLFDWTGLGLANTALRFVLINTGSGDVTVTPEAAYESAGPAESGTQAPAAFTVGAGQSYGDPYGVDEMRPYWRAWVTGTSTFRWGVMAIPR